jgi:hypothetical protein
MYRIIKQPYDTGQQQSHQMQADQLWQHCGCGAHIFQIAEADLMHATKRQVAQAAQQRKVEAEEAGTALETVLLIIKISHRRQD